MALTQVPPALLTATTGTGSTVVLSASPTFTGTITTPGVTFSDASSQTAAASPYVLKNRIINGAMVIDQRNAGASIATTVDYAETYTLDRWYYRNIVASKYTIQQNAASVTPPTGFTNYLGCTSTSAYTVGAAEFFTIGQAIEGFNVADLDFGKATAKTITLSFQVRSSLTGTFGGVVANSGFTRTYPFTYSIPVANTWTTVSITISGDTSGTWLTTNGIGLNVRFSLGTGSTYSGTAGAWGSATVVSATGATSVVGTNGATFYITGVQLEQNTSATPFERRLYNQELANCQRYCCNISLTAAGDFGVGACTSGGVQAFVPYPVTMRSAPTVTFSTAGNFLIADGTAGYTVTSTGTSNITTNQTTANMGASGTTGGRSGLLRWNTGTAFILSSAEL